MIRFIKYFTQSIFIYLFFLIGRILGLKLSRLVFSNLFLRIAKFFKTEKILDSNLNIFSKNISENEKKEIKFYMWKNYGMTFIEYIYLGFFKKNTSHIKIEGEKNLKFLLEKKNQAIFVSGHFANFELMSMEITKKNIKLATIYRPLNNYFLNPFMEYLRKKYVCENQIKKGLNGVRDTINFIKNGSSIAMMIDQRVSEGEKVNFFSKPALTTTLPAQLAIKFNLPIIPVYIEREKDNNFFIEFHKGINPKEFLNKIEITQKLNQILEKMIKKNPRQWIWTHNRWK
mgnify:FL=1|tara:strand:- start:4847 stop:5704 length:858 start_codon:yes stop_codon:yes gene_type:complete